MKVSNRDFSRNYKALREKLLLGQVDEILVPQKNGTIIKVVMVSEESSAKRWLKKIKGIKPIHIKRPKEDLFDL